MPADPIACSRIRYHKFKTATRQISLRNIGTNTLWVSFDRKHWFDVACGTSFDDRVNVNGFWYCTQIGVTAFVVNGLTLNLIDVDAPMPADDELEP